MKGAVSSRVRQPVWTRHSSSVLLRVFLCVLCASAVTSVSAQEWKAVADGVEHAQVRREFSGKLVDINLLRLDLKKVRLDVHHALDRAIGLETTSSIATRKGAIAAINGGFFRLDKSQWAGDAAGILIIDGNLWSEPVGDRIAFRILNGGPATNIKFDRFYIESFLERDGVSARLSGINRARGIAEMVVYTPAFGDSTLTDPSGIEVAFRNCAGAAICSVTVFENAGNSRIPPDGFVLSIGPGYREDSSRLLEKLTRKPDDQLSTRVTLVSRFTGLPQFRLASTDDITNGLPQLIKNGKVEITWEQEKASRSFVETRHPRTAVAKLKDGKFLMLTADGRSEASAGLDLYDLAKYMLELGAVDAMNLDGGGSTTMYLDGKVVNKPSDKEGERKIGDAILVTLRKPRKH
jgi:hypothetical protein